MTIQDKILIYKKALWYLNNVSVVDNSLGLCYAIGISLIEFNLLTYSNKLKLLIPLFALAKKEPNNIIPIQADILNCFQHYWFKVDKKGMQLRKKILKKKIKNLEKLL